MPVPTPRKKTINRGARTTWVRATDTFRRAIAFAALDRDIPVADLAAQASPGISVDHAAYLTYELTQSTKGRAVAATPRLLQQAVQLALLIGYTGPIIDVDEDGGDK